MAKVTGPCLSLDAAGTIGKLGTFQKRPSGHSFYLRKYPGGREPFTSSPAQNAQRTIIGNLVAAWRALDVNYRNQWDDLAKEIGEVGTGYHLYIKLGGIYPGIVNVLDFDGSDDYISVLDAASLKGYSEMTIETWLKLKATNTINSPILSKYGDYFLHVGPDNKVIGLICTANDTHYLYAESGEDWSGGTGWDTSNFIQGTASHYMNKALGWTDAGSYMNPPSTPLDWSGIASTNYLTIWFYVDDVNSLHTTNAFIYYVRTKAKNWNNFYTKTIVKSLLRSGWNLLQVRKDAFSVGGGTPDWAQVYDLNISHYPSAAKPAVQFKYDHIFWTGQEAVITTADIGSTAWKHIVMSYDGSNVRLYLNGSLQDTNPQTGMVKSGTVSLKIGKAYTGNPGKLNAVQGETRIWNKALNAADIMIHAKKYRDLSFANTSGCSLSNLKLHYKMLEGSGIVLMDSSGNGNTGVFKAAGEPAWKQAALFKDIYGLT